VHKRCLIAEQKSVGRAFKGGFGGDLVGVRGGFLNGVKGGAATACAPRGRRREGWPAPRKPHIHRPVRGLWPSLTSISLFLLSFFGGRYCVTTVLVITKVPSGNGGDYLAYSVHSECLDVIARRVVIPSGHCCSRRKQVTGFLFDIPFHRHPVPKNTYKSPLGLLWSPAWGLPSSLEGGSGRRRLLKL